MRKSKAEGRPWCSLRTTFVLVPLPCDWLLSSFSSNHWLYSPAFDNCLRLFLLSKLLHMKCIPWLIHQNNKTGEINSFCCLNLRWNITEMHLQHMQPMTQSPLSKTIFLNVLVKWEGVSFVFPNLYLMVAPDLVFSYVKILFSPTTHSGNCSFSWHSEFHLTPPDILRNSEFLFIDFLNFLLYDCKK